jgi:hypothetical protein
MHAESIHHPGHGLSVAVNIARGNILPRPDEGGQLGGETPGNLLQFSLGKVLVVAADPALGSAIWQSHHRALPGYPNRQGLDVIEGYVGMEADPAFGRPPVDVVLDPVAGEDFEFAGALDGRDGYDKDRFGMLELLVNIGVEVEFFSHPVKLLEANW